MLKRIFSLLVMMCVIISSASMSYAIPSNNFIEVREIYSFEELAKMPGSKTVNEFDAIKELGEEEVYEFKKMLYEMSKENEIDLMSQGIEQRRIKVIKSLEDIGPEKITDEQARLASARMRFYLYSGSFNDREASFSCYWAWDSAPMNAYDDILAFAWTSGYTINLSRSDMLVEYEDVYGKYLGRKTFNPRGKVGGGSFTFPQSYNSPGLRGISKGNAYVVVRNDEDKDYIEVQSNYGHSKLNLIPSFSIDGSLSINFDRNISTMGEDYVYFR